MRASTARSSSSSCPAWRGCTARTLECDPCRTGPPEGSRAGRDGRAGGILAVRAVVRRQYRMCGAAHVPPAPPAGRSSESMPIDVRFGADRRVVYGGKWPAGGEYCTYHSGRASSSVYSASYVRACGAGGARIVGAGQQQSDGALVSGRRKCRHRYSICAAGGSGSVSAMRRSPKARSVGGWRPCRRASVRTSWRIGKSRTWKGTGWRWSGAPRPRASRP
jgi:hypothetical protein